MKIKPKYQSFPFDAITFTMSDFVIMPTIFLPRTTGNPLIPCRIIMIAAVYTTSLGDTKKGFGVIMSFAENVSK